MVKGKIIFVTGGARSGKSKWAQEHAESLSGPHFFLATAPVLDEEMARKIQRHQKERESFHWKTIEEGVYLTNVIKLCGTGTIIVDCLTLWVNNLIYQAGQTKQVLDEEQIAERARAVTDAVASFNGTCIFVTNETGLGLVPENPAARNFRDLAGRCNQVFAEASHEAWLLVSGISMRLK